MEEKKYARKKVEGRAYARTLHLRTKDPKDGAITIAYRPGKAGGLEVGLAFCAPDDCFSKKEGCRRARKKLYSNPLRFPDLVSGWDAVIDKVVLDLLSASYSGSTHVCEADGVTFFEINMGATYLAVIRSKTLHVCKPFLGASWLGRVKPWVFDLVKALQS